MQGHRVHVASFNPATLPEYEPASVHYLWEKISSSGYINRVFKALIILWRLRRLLRRVNADIVHSHSAGGYAWAALLSGFRPYVVTPWGTDLLVDIRNSKINRFLTAATLRRASFVSTDGVHFIDILRELGVKREKIVLHAFGTNVDRFSPGSAGEIRKQLRIRSDAPVVISTRTLNPVHDVETFIRAIPIVNDFAKDCHFLVVGGGVEEGRLKSLCKELKIDEVVHFMGMVNEMEMRSLLRAANVYVSTSVMDAGLAGSTAEAMATALPVIHTDNSDNKEWVSQGVGGAVFPTRDAKALGDAVCQLLARPAVYEAMGKRNRQVITERNNMDVELRKVESEYFRVLDKK